MENNRRFLSSEDIDRIAYNIIGCSIEVFNTIGNGFQEVIYQRCLSIEMHNKGIDHQREIEYPVLYKGQQVGTRRADYIVEENIMVELKAVVKLEPAHLAQALNYTIAYDLPIGLLINFGGKSLEFHRLINNNYK